MPILPKGKVEFPDDLLEGYCDLSDERLWRALYTKPRQEKSLADELFQLEIPFYLPLVQQTRRIRGKSVPCYLPVFPSYLFLFGTDDEQYVTQKTNRVVQVVEVKDQQQLMGDLQNISKMLAADVPLTIERRLAPGTRVRVKDGPFKDVEGVVVRRKGKKSKLVVAAKLFQQGVSVEIDDYFLEPLSPLPPLAR